MYVVFTHIYLQTSPIECLVLWFSRVFVEVPSLLETLHIVWRGAGGPTNIADMTRKKPIPTQDFATSGVFFLSTFRKAKSLQRLCFTCCCFVVVSLKAVVFSMNHHKVGPYISYKWSYNHL